MPSIKRYQTIHYILRDNDHFYVWRVKLSGTKKQTLSEVAEVSCARAAGQHKCAKSGRRCADQGQSSLRGPLSGFPGFKMKNKLSGWNIWPTLEFRMKHEIVYFVVEGRRVAFSTFQGLFNENWEPVLETRLRPNSTCGRYRIQGHSNEAHRPTSPWAYDNLWHIMNLWACGPSVSYCFYWRRWGLGTYIAWPQWVVTSGNIGQRW